MGWFAMDAVEAPEAPVYVVGASCDVDGDGHIDVVGGAPVWEGHSYPPEPTGDPGSLYVWYGGPGGLEADAEVLPGITGVVFPLEVTCVSNGGGGEYGAVVASTFDGEVYAWFGSAGGLGDEPDRVWQGESAFGQSLLAMDLDRDGVEDLLIGDPSPDPETNRALPGRVLLVRGASDGLADTFELVFEGPTADGSIGLDLWPGDFNGDGFADVFASGSTENVVAPGEPDGFGAPYVLPSVIGYDWVVGDFDDDGYDDALCWGTYGPTLVPGGPEGLVEFEWDVPLGEVSAAGYTWSRPVEAPGDVNADGIDDLLVLDEYDGSGIARLYPGSPAGFVEGAYELFTGIGEEALFGASANGVGDLDGDGFEDFAVAAPGTGHVYVFGGRDDGDGDGFSWLEDCDDDRADAYPGGTEVADDGVDQDCDGADVTTSADTDSDTDADGVTWPDGSSDDAEAGCGCRPAGAAASPALGVFGILLAGARRARRRRERS